MRSFNAGGQSRVPTGPPSLPECCTETFVLTPSMSPLSQFFLKINVLIFDWAGSSCCTWVLLYLQHVGFSLQWLLGCGTQALGARASVVTAHRLSCPSDMWNLLGPGMEPVSSELSGGFLTIGPPGKFLFIPFLKDCLKISTLSDFDSPLRLSSFSGDSL